MVDGFRQRLDERKPAEDDPLFGADADHPSFRAVDTRFLRLDSHPLTESVPDEFDFDGLATTGPYDFAQFELGSVVGTVKDPAGLPVPLIAVQIRSLATNVTRASVTSDAR